MEKIGCFVEITVTYKGLDSADFTCELVHDKAFGLDDDDLYELNLVLESCLSSGDTMEELFIKISEKLREFNESTREVIKLKNQKKEALEAE